MAAKYYIADVEYIETSRRKGGYFNYTTINLSDVLINIEKNKCFIHTKTGGVIVKLLSGKYLKITNKKEITENQFKNKLKLQASKLLIRLNEQKAVEEIENQKREKEYEVDYKKAIDYIKKHSKEILAKYEQKKNTIQGSALSSTKSSKAIAFYFYKKAGVKGVIMAHAISNYFFDK